MTPQSSETQPTPARPSRGSRRLLSVIVLFGTLAVLSFAASAYLYFTAIRTDGSPAPLVALPTGQLAPEFQVRTLEGEELTLSELRGQPVWLNFWATWCAPCKAEIPAMLSVTGDPGSGAVRLIAVNMGEERRAVERYLEANGFRGLPTAMDEGGVVANSYRVYGLPTHVFIDSGGIIRDVRARQLDAAEMRAAIARLE